VIRQSLQLGALFQTTVALAFAGGAPLYQLLSRESELLPERYGTTLGLLAASAAALFLLSQLPFARSLSGGKALLALLALLLPWTDLELCLRAFVELESPETNLFLRDRDLGWRLRPGADTDWGGYRVQINQQGLRGPPLPFVRESESLRILYLGDSVTFGYKLQKAEHSFPFQTERLLEEHFELDVETINAGVGGYSPWQERAYLERDGLRYAPDLVVVGFVLNDVTEKMSLRLFGGRGIGSQLSVSYQSGLDWLLRHSAVHHVARSLYARLRFGPDVATGALEQEALDIRHLMQDDPGERVEEAWRITLENLDGIFELCDAAGIPVVLVVFPDLLQFPTTAKRDQPQGILTAHARQRGVPVLDLLPPMVQAARHQPREWQRFFIDHDHLTAAGSEVVAQLLRSFVIRNCHELLPAHCGGRTGFAPASAWSPTSGRIGVSHAIRRSLPDRGRGRGMAGCVAQEPRTLAARGPPPGVPQVRGGRAQRAA
jgi:lysophospholipase L1-like esterase